MAERPKIHIFLGAPPPSSLEGLEAGAGLECEECPPPDWRLLGLTWQAGRLRPASDGEGGEPRIPSVEERTSRGNVEPDPSRPQSPGDGTSADQEHWESDRTPEEPLGRKRRVGSDCRSASDEGDLRPAGRVQNQDDESNPDKEGVCPGSVGEYLAGCFPAAQLEPEPACEHQPGPAAPPLSTQTHYLSTWTLAQALILRGVQSAASLPPQTPTKVSRTPPSVSSSTPELFSPLPPSRGASGDLFSPPGATQRMEGGIVIQATTEGVLCSQEEQQGSSVAQSSHSKPPDLKRSQISENLRMEAPAVASGCGAAASTTAASTTAASTAAARLRGPTTLLIRCDKRGTRYSVLVAVVHPCHLKEVKVRSGPSAGTIVPLASIVVTDRSGVEVKVVLWRRAAFWALTVSPGDILLITGLQVNEDRWRGETVLQSTFKSKLLNLGQITASTSPPVSQNVNAHSLSALCDFLREHRPLLVSLNLRPPQDLNRLPYATLRSLRVNMLVHALLRVTHTHISTEWRSEAESRCRSAVQLKAVLTVEQPNSQQGALLLWGSAVDWLPRFKRDRAAVWDFHVLLVREGLTSDLPELHSTPWSSVQLLDRANRQAQEFFQPRTSRTGNNSSSIELDLDTLLSQKYSGDVELRVQVTSFHFRDPLPSQNAPQPVLDSSTSLVGILAALGGDITYTGCGRCCTELDTDANGIYCPCYPCLPHMAVRCYYRLGVLTVSGRGSDQVCVQVPPVPLQKIFEAPPDKLHRYSAPGSEVKHIQVAAERIQTLLSLPRKLVTITIQSHFLCDENGVAISQDLTLLDLQFPADPHRDQVPAAAVQPR